MMPTFDDGGAQFQPDDVSAAEPKAAGASDREEGSSPVTVAEAVMRLAKLSPFEYEACRRAEARNLGLRQSVLDVAVERGRAAAERAFGAGTVVGAQPHPADPRGRTDLFVDRADLPDTAIALTELLAQRPMLFDRGVPVRLARDSQRDGLIATPLDLAGVVNEAHAISRPWSYTKDRDGGLIRQDVTLPDRVGRLYLDLRGQWGLRPLDGIASAPLLGDNGSARVVDGYDPHTRMWCERIPEVELPDRPTEADAQDALRRIRARFRTFPFATAERVTLDGFSVPMVNIEKSAEQDESAALTALLTAVARPSQHFAPALAVGAPNFSGAGSGKGLLVRAICSIAFGASPLTITAGANAEELEKRIASALMEAAPAVTIDNLNSTALRSATLESALTERPSFARVMGSNRVVALNATTFVAVTGNGLTLSGDTARRFLSVELDAGLEDPETRVFTGNLLAEIARDRGTLLSDVLTIFRWGRQQGDNLPNGKALGSFDQWCRWCRDPLLALGCADPVERITAAKLNDPRRRVIAELYHAWYAAHGSASVTVAGLAQSVHDSANSEGKPRQWLAARIRNLVGTRMSGYVLAHSPTDGKWSADHYQLQPADHAGRPGA